MADQAADAVRRTYDSVCDKVLGDYPQLQNEVRRLRGVAQRRGGLAAGEQPGVRGTWFGHGHDITA
jgi:hypothetical protein